MSNISENAALNLSKKRKLNPENHRRNKIRNARVKGIEFTNWQGKVIEARKTGPDCMCRMRCFSNFDAEERQRILNRFNSLNSKNEQDIYLQQLLEKLFVKTHRPRTEDPKNRQCNFGFYVLNGSDRLKVCKKAFISLHGITEARTRRLCLLLLESRNPFDMRGKHENRRVIPEDVIQKIHNHIESFPKQVTRQGKKKVEYLDASLNVKTMHTLFLLNNPDVLVKYDFYLSYFKQNFNLRFGSPQQDNTISHPSKIRDL